jgi:hypothetical protein
VLQPVAPFYVHDGVYGTLFHSVTILLKIAALKKHYAVDCNQSSVGEWLNGCEKGFLCITDTNQHMVVTDWLMTG